MTTKKKATKKLLLKDLLTLYLAHRNSTRPINSTLAVKTRTTFESVVSVFSKFLCRPSTIDDLNAECINKFLHHLFINGRSDYTVKNRRTHLRALWKFAHTAGLAPEWGGVQNVRVNPLNIQGFDQAALTKLVEYCSTLRGVVRNTGLPKRMWWTTWLLVDWECGIRSGDMFNITPADFDKAGWLWIIESKTGKRGWRRLRPSVCERLAPFIDFEDSRATIWPGYKRRHFYRAFGELCDKAGVEGTARWIRRGSASEVEKLHPGAAWKYLRHSVPTLFDTHYRVDRIVEEKPLLPPEIEPQMFEPKATK